MSVATTNDLSFENVSVQNQTTLSKENLVIKNAQITPLKPVENPQNRYNLLTPIISEAIYETNVQKDDISRIELG